MHRDACGTPKHGDRTGGTRVELSIAIGERVDGQMLRVRRSKRLKDSAAERHMEFAELRNDLAPIRSFLESGAQTRWTRAGAWGMRGRGVGDGGIGDWLRRRSHKDLERGSGRVPHVGYLRK